MKRLRVNLVSVGLLVLAGIAGGTDDWQPATSPVGKATRESTEPIWLPASSLGRPIAATIVSLPSDKPDVPTGPTATPELPTEPGLPIGPRTRQLPSKDLSVIPPLPEETLSQPFHQEAPIRDGWRSPSSTFRQPPVSSEIPKPLGLQHSRSQPLTTPPATNQLPRPRTSDDPQETPTSKPEVTLPTVPIELPVAPPELMIPPGVQVPGKHGTFGSTPIRLSRDYPSLADLYPKLFNTGAAEPADMERGFVQTENLLWWMSGLDIPILATTNPNPGSFGFLGEPGTVSILGPGTFLGSSRQGFRVRGGLWLNEGGALGVDGSVFVLGRRSAEVTFNSDRFPLITRPVFSPNIRPNQPNEVIGQVGEAVAVPGILRGSLTVEATSLLWGADANLRKCIYHSCDASVLWYVGYRNLNLNESLTITENILVIGPGGNRVLIPDPIGTYIAVRDHFATANRFHGGQLGVMWERRWGVFSVNARASVALGATSQKLTIFGAQTRTRPGQLPLTYSGGLLAAGPNLGTFNRNEFSVVPEITLNLGYWLTPYLKAFVGYNFLFWSNVIRPGEQIDPVVDLTFVPNAPVVPFSGQYRPRPLFRQSDLWVTGLQLGLEWRW